VKYGSILVSPLLLLERECNHG